MSNQGFPSSFSLTFIAAYTIKCYVCSGVGDTCSKDNLEKNSIHEVNCDIIGAFDRCIRVWAKSENGTIVITNSCANKKICETTEKACDEFKEGECAVGCCDSNLCNAGSPISFSVFLMTVCSALGLALLK